MHQLQGLFVCYPLLLPSPWSKREHHSRWVHRGYPTDLQTPFPGHVFQGCIHVRVYLGRYGHCTYITKSPILSTMSLSWLPWGINVTYT